MRDDFHPGDVVMLKAGGPKMTVDFVDEARQVLCCMWVEGGRPRSGSFPVARVEPYRPRVEIVSGRSPAGVERGWK
jgi:uncharacterized protein YodC (DUF2158 family)